MKKSLLTLTLAAVCLGATAQTNPGAPAPTPAAVGAPAGYAAMMAQTVAAITGTGDATELRALAGQMERAAQAVPTDWLPRYYQAYALVINAFQSKDAGDAKDKTLDQAEAALGQARQLKGDESELLALQAYLYQARLRISPAERAQQYLEKVEAATARAQALNPANPRPYLIAANNAYYTPAAFGGGPAAAKPLYDEAKAKFAAFRPTSALAPAWGQGQVLARLKQYEVAPAPAAK